MITIPVERDKVSYMERPEGGQYTVIHIPAILIEEDHRESRHDPRYVKALLEASSKGYTHLFDDWGSILLLEDDIYSFVMNNSVVRVREEYRGHVIYDYAKNRDYGSLEDLIDDDPIYESILVIVDIVKMIQ